MDIIVDHLTKIYGTQRAVDDISFKISTGEIVGFLGPNGAGKTTTMKSIVCYISPDGGNIQVGPYNIYDEPDEIKRRIGYLPEQNPLYEDMYIVDYLRFVAELQQVPSKDIPARIQTMIERCGLTPEKHKKIGMLSKGYKQRVGLAQALIHDPEVLILDEPTSGLDPNQIIEIRELIKTVGKEKTVLLSSHILAEVEATCDRILIINQGKLVADGTAEILRKETQKNEVLRIHIEKGETSSVLKALQALPSIQGVEVEPVVGSFVVTSQRGTSSRKAIFSLCVEKGWDLTEIAQVETKLEDVFRTFTHKAS